MEKANKQGAPVVIDKDDEKAALMMAQAVYAAMLCALYVLREYAKKEGAKC